MALRGNSGEVNIGTASTPIAHGLTSRVAGVARQPVTPTEYWVVPTTAVGAGGTYRSALPDATNLYFAQAGSATSAVVFFALPHAVTL